MCSLTVSALRLKRYRDWGTFLRSLRVKHNLSLHELARLAHITPTYLFRLEKGELRPPAEDTLVAMAAALGEEADNFLNNAGRIASDLLRIIGRDPRRYGLLLRSTGGLSSRELEALCDTAQQMKRTKRRATAA